MDKPFSVKVYQPTNWERFSIWMLCSVFGFFTGYGLGMLIVGG